VTSSSVTSGSVTSGSVTSGSVTSGGVTMDVLLRDKIAEAGDRYAASLNVDPTDDGIILNSLQ
jgi:hypothetical protein